MKDEEAKEAFIEDINLLRSCGINIVIVHGGGPEISKWLDISGIESRFIKGLRVTDSKVMEIVQMVLAGNVNKDLSLKLSLNGINAIGISGVDSKLIKAEKKYLYEGNEVIDIGFVGDVVSVNERLILSFLKNGQTPVIAPIGCDENGNIYNINADYAASFISSALKSEKLIILTDVEGVYKDINDKSSLIPHLTTDDIKQYINEGVICGGMIPKMECCMDAVERGTNSVHLVDGRKKHSLLTDIFENLGTTIVKEYDKVCQEVI